MTDALSPAAKVGRWPASGEAPVAVTVDKLVKRYGAETVLRDVDLAVEGGELVALLGPSGSGKTTLLRTVAGLERPDGGRILFGSRDVANLPVQHRRVGFVFQNYALFRHMRVVDNIGFGLSVLPRGQRPARAAIRARAEELLELVQLGGLGRRFPHQLSGGQRQRVALARALAIDPQLLLLDEPFGALDAKVRRELRRWLRSLHDSTGHTALFVTHDQEEAMELADRVVVMEAGRAVQVGKPADIYDRPATPFVFGFIGESAMLPAQVSGGRITVAGRPVAVARLEDRRGAEAGRDGAALLAFRPHQARPADASAHDGLAGRVVTVRRHGPVMRVALQIEGAPGLPAPGLPVIEIDLPVEAAPSPGDAMVLALAEAVLFCVSAAQPGG